MIQELLGGGNVGLIGGERSKFSDPNGGFLHGSVSPSPSSTPSPSSSAGAATAPAAAMENLRCPRCDSSNTKFCYYNNYNLTQPRHFCKTCRRYWTKGGALRNVPIGGGCRKNKSTTIAAAVGKASSTVGKLKTFSPEMGKSTALFSGFEQADPFTQSPILWATPQNSHILSLLRANQQNPSPNPLSSPGKVEGGFDPSGPIPVPPIGLSNSFHRNNQHQAQTNQAIMLGEVQNNGIQELYQPEDCRKKALHISIPIMSAAPEADPSPPKAHLQENPDWVRDIVLWRRKDAGILILLAATAIWVAMEIYGFKLVTLFSWLAMAIVVCLFAWGNLNRVFNRDSPDVSRLEISEQTAVETATLFLERINEAIRMIIHLGAHSQWLVFAGVMASLYVLSLLGSYLDVLTIWYIGVVGGLTVPLIYAKNEKKINESAEKLRIQSERLYFMVREKLQKLINKFTGKQKEPIKEKKAE
ncbi:hypothetical protein F511_01949 [Dorcoceras hygrometricum]|uniref:Multifunctional fusion protein n=1 Tax=Dorcoceras hygrometricum TaxID=472368 RepID=A0A2Z7AZX7_9LAMI|nr:hypothetical protein F511_01949 [Dorcoceras hygrometricum]